MLGTDHPPFGHTDIFSMHAPEPTDLSPSKKFYDNRAKPH